MHACNVIVGRLFRRGATVAFLSNSTREQSHAVLSREENKCVIPLGVHLEQKWNKDNITVRKLEVNVNNIK